LFDRMDELLGHPTIDPHGSPIPDKSGNIAAKEYVSLSELNQLGEVRLCALSNTSNDFLVYLNSRQLELGMRINIEQIEAFDRSMTVSYAGFDSVMLSSEVCERLLVEMVAAG